MRVDDEGRYRFDALTPGVYLVQAEAGGFPRSEPIVVLLDQGARLISTIIGVLKAGKFWINLDPQLRASLCQYGDRSKGS